MLLLSVSEMGLGKTVEIISLILANPAPALAGGELTELADDDEDSMEMQVGRTVFAGILRAGGASRGCSSGLVRWAFRQCGAY